MCAIVADRWQHLMSFFTAVFMSSINLEKAFKIHACKINIFVLCIHSY